ncbi:Chromosome partition protein smc, partial [hydrothermal vent metagenome]
KAPDAVLEWFNQIKICADADAAKALTDKLAAGESVVTQQGEWLGRNWVHINRGEQAEGFLLRQKELKQLEKQIATHEVQLTALQEESTNIKTQRVSLVTGVEQLQLDVNMSHRKLSELNGLVLNKQQLIAREQQQSQEKAAETVQIQKQMSDDEQQVKSSRVTLETAMNALAKFEQLKIKLLDQQQAFQQQYHQTKAQLNDTSNQYYQHKMGLSATSNKIESLLQNIERTQQAVQDLVARKDDLLKQLTEDMDPIEGNKQTLDDLISQRLSTEKGRDAMRQQVTASQSKLDELERFRHQHQSHIDDARNKLEAAKLAFQSNQLRANGFAEQLKDQGYAAAELLKTLREINPEMTVESLPALIEQKEQRTEKLQRNIVRLEPVNLAAIEEFEEESKRKQYLDEQNDDLVQALDTLEQAIARIDKDTRTLFKETFEAVNSNIKQLFPRLFGGGHAYLELTGNDLLTTGVSIMARPPGKRVSSIQLLSGGEKALTAVSLVFAIFNLNPAPFCLLDEVDAPLDDANVARFSAMVIEMSEKVQFLFVSHNKVTMEIANQLMGVTMREPGVSRLVSVDLAEAAQLATD